MSALNYRPEIDGLRAVAVLSVILFHAGVPFFSGGYVGVDIFFVISGFLITSLIVKDLNAGTFSFAEFWERRARRILPAQFLVMAATLCACFFLYFPDDLLFAAKQALSQLVFSSNIYFYNETDYFSSDQVTKPFQHFWSLAVEEQFYFIIPPALWLLWRYRRNWPLRALAAAAALSFVACVVVMRNDAGAAFYLLPYRAWELLLGGLVAIAPYKPFEKKVEQEIAGIAGLMLISFAVAGYSPDTLFPGVAALVPCLGAVLVIMAAAPDTVAGRFLTLRPMVFIGLISYALYLWHWPFLIIAEYLRPADFTWALKAPVLCAVFILSFLSWKYVETPLRKRGGARERNIFAAGAAAVALVLAVAGGLQIHFHNKKMERLEVAMEVSRDKPKLEKNTYFDNCTLTDKDLKLKDICQTNKDGGIKPDFAVWGDSYAKTSIAAYFELSKEYGRNGYVLSKANCPPIFDVIMKGEKEREECRRINDRVFRFLVDHKIKSVFVAGNWTRWVENPSLEYAGEGRLEQSDNALVGGAHHSIQRLVDAGITPYFVINQAYLPFDAPHLLEVEKRMGVRETKAKIPLKKYKEERAENLDLLLSSFKDMPVVVVDPLSVLCPEDYCIASDNGVPLYMDRGHLSVAGARFVKPMLAPFFKAGFTQPAGAHAASTGKALPAAR